MRLKILTLNIMHGGEQLDEVAEFLNVEDPDIVFLQEVHNSQDVSIPKNFRTLLYLKQKVPKLTNVTFYPDFADVILDVGKIDRGNAILSKYQIQNSSQSFLFGSYQEILDEKSLSEWSSVPRSMVHGEIILENISLHLYNVHGIWGHDGNDSAKRLAMSKIITDTIVGKENVILAGDFNLRPETETITAIEKDLKNVFKDELVSTFNMKHKTDPGFASAVVDMMFVSPHLSVVDHYMPRVDVSDHMPLVAILEV